MALFAGIGLAFDAPATEFVDILPSIERSIVHIGPQPTGSDRGEALTTGSGVVIRTDGYTLTVDHVAGASAGALQVRMADGRALPAKIVGADKRSGVAVLRVDATGLAVAAQGRSSELRRAEPVWAVGRLHPALSGDIVVSSGIVSSTNRTAPQFQPFVQSTAAFHPAMGGGGLFNARGQLVAINSQVWKPTGGGGNVVVSFSIPIDEAARVANDLIAFGPLQRGSLGFQIDRVTPEMANTVGLKETAGALVRDVRPGGAGERAGLRAGDIVLAINGQSIGTYTDVPAVIGSTKPGDPVRLQIFRRGSQRELSAVADAAP